MDMVLGYNPAIIKIDSEAHKALQSFGMNDKSKCLDICAVLT